MNVTPQVSISLLAGSVSQQADPGLLTDNSGGAPADGTIGVVTLPTGVTLGTLTGTADQAMEAVPDPTDTPADADALRDDLVAAVLPTIRNNFKEFQVAQAANLIAITALRSAIKELATKINAIDSALVAAGVTA